jgi:hypothetical protein
MFAFVHEKAIMRLSQLPLRTGESELHGETDRTIS